MQLFKGKNNNIEFLFYMLIKINFKWFFCNVKRRIMSNLLENLGDYQYFSDFYKYDIKIKMVK